MLLAQLVEQGKINLDAEVQTYVSCFPKKKYPITVRQLLYHLDGTEMGERPPHFCRTAKHQLRDTFTRYGSTAVFDLGSPVENTILVRNSIGDPRS